MGKGLGEGKALFGPLPINGKKQHCSADLSMSGRLR
jgi:hypothetical protein